ncbi:hypothetical protein [Mycobacteroides chelonae]|uniref:hypothetical protein n=1 Tax=Mycobacteroides chelonae TaxID=1774 RepID=UPI0008AA0460|nr:hypothetical protein [Mycobacteroides chelonae]OHU12785.1 hypothetical protein BKG75_17360 [Mycobacteroides chelonae]
MAITTLAEALGELSKCIDAYAEAQDGPSGDAEHSAANELADAAELVLDLAQHHDTNTGTAKSAAAPSREVRDDVVEEVVPLVIDDDDGAHVYDVFWTEEDALTELRRYLVERFGEDTVTEAEANESQGLSSLVCFKTTPFALPLRRG